MWCIRYWMRRKSLKSNIVRLFRRLDSLGYTIRIMVIKRWIGIIIKVSNSRVSSKGSKVNNSNSRNSKYNKVSNNSNNSNNTNTNNNNKTNSKTTTINITTKNPPITT